MRDVNYGVRIFFSLTIFCKLSRYKFTLTPHFENLILSRERVTINCYLNRMLQLAEIPTYAKPHLGEKLSHCRYKVVRKYCNLNKMLQIVELPTYANSTYRKSLQVYISSGTRILDLERGTSVGQKKLSERWQIEQDARA